MPLLANSWMKAGGITLDSRDVMSALKQAGLDYTVHQERLKTVNDLPVDGVVANVDSLGRVKGVVGTGYAVIQNEEAFQLAADVVRNSDYKLSAGGETSGGLIYMIAESEGKMINGEPFNQTLIFKNSFNGSSSMGVMITNMRVFCSNQFRGLFKKMHIEGISCLHYQSGREKMETYKLTIDTANKNFEMTKRLLELQAITNAGKDTMEQMLALIAPIGVDSNMPGVEKKRQAFIDCYNSEDNQNFRGKNLGYLNAYFEYTTHRMGTRNTTRGNEIAVEQMANGSGIDSRVIDLFI